MTCWSENYDVDGNLLGGCEQLQPSPGHTSAALALPLGAFSCEDGSSAQNLSGVLLADEREHLNPTPTGFDPDSGSAPYGRKLLANGLGICSNDLVFEVTTTGGTAAQCYQLNILGGTETYELPVAGNATAKLASGASYSDGATLFFEFERTCAAAPDKVLYTVKGHL
jgi:hypothetical protein